MSRTLYFDSLFKLNLNYERHGHGSGMFIISKMILPLMHSLGHSNYSNSIHRLVCRVLSSTTPQEALKLVFERFSNRNGKEGGNIFKDRRVEFRIRVLKQLLGNLGPHMDTNNIQKVNAIIDIKEKLFYHARKSHGVKIRSGAHKKRSDEVDYQILFDDLTKTEAHKKFEEGRMFGNVKYPENLLDSEIFNKASFYRWLTQKNKESVAAYAGSLACYGLPGASERDPPPT